MANSANSASASESISSHYASSLQSTHREPQNQHVVSFSNGMKSITDPKPPRAPSLKAHDLAQRSKRDKCLDYLIDLESNLRGQIMQLQSLSSHAIHLQETLHDAQSPIALAAHALDSSLANMQHIMRGNIALIDHAKSTWSASVSETASSPAASAHKIAPLLHSETSSLISFSSDEYDASPNDLSCGLTDKGTVSSPGQDLLVGNAPKSALEARLQPQQLQYHPDVADLQDFMIHAPLPENPHSATHPLQSRRIILSNLPPSITPAQVLQGIHPHGSLQRITMLTAPPFCSRDTHSALLEFVHPISAATCVKALLSRPGLHSDPSGRTFQARAWLIPTPSYPHSSPELSLLHQGWSRTLRVENVPQAATWYFLSVMVGLENLVAVRGPACYGDDGLVLEFATIHEAARVGRLIARDRSAFAHLGIHHLSFVVVADSAPKTGCHIFNAERVIKYIPPDFLERRWNRHPFNTCFPPEIQAPKQQQQQQQQQQDHHNLKSSQEPLCSWSQYGLLAKQRREKAESLVVATGREEAEDIKRAPVPAVVREYLDTSTFQIINTGS